MLELQYLSQLLSYIWCQYEPTRFLIKDANKIYYERMFIFAVFMKNLVIYLLRNINE